MSYMQTFLKPLYLDIEFWKLCIQFLQHLAIRELLQVWTGLSVLCQIHLYSTPSGMQGDHLAGNCSKVNHSLNKYDNKTHDSRTFNNHEPELTQDTINSNGVQVNTYIDSKTNYCSSRMACVCKYCPWHSCVYVPFNNSWGKRK